MLNIFKSFILVVILGLLNLTVSYSKTHDVMVSSNVFTPRDIVIEAGDTVRWINTGGTHNVYEVNGRFRCAQGCEAAGGNGDPSNTMWESEVSFHTVETVSYICQPHIGFGMQGSVTVVAPTNASQVYATIENEFIPQIINIVEGQKVNFVNQLGNHNIHFAEDISCSIGCSNDGTNLQNSATGFSWDIYVGFNQIGEHPYYCDVHEIIGQPGIINVIPETIFKNGFE